MGISCHSTCWGMENQGAEYYLVHPFIDDLLGRQLVCRALSPSAKLPFSCDQHLLRGVTITDLDVLRRQRNPPNISGELFLVAVTMGSPIAL